MSGNVWKLEFDGGFFMRNPDGTPAQFETRKARAIVAMLALRNGRAIRRAEIAATLWPVVAKETAALNLRKCLQRVRRALGPSGPIRIGKEFCWLDMELVSISPWDTSRLLPEMTEPWFDAFRPRAAKANDHRDGTTVEGFLSVFEWAARHRPCEGILMASRMPELTEMSLPERIEPALHACMTAMNPRDAEYGWGAALLGVSASVTGNLPAVIRQMTGAYRHGIEHDDDSLRAFSAFYLVGSLVTAGRAAETNALISDTRTLRLSGDIAVRLRHGRALALLHGGKFTQGFQEFKEARELFGPRTALYEKASLLANYAWFESSVGNPQAADEIIQELNELPFTDCPRIRLTVELANGHSMIRQGHPLDAQPVLESVLETGAEHRLAGFEIYASEALAACALANGNSAGAKVNVQRACRIRNAHRFAVTAWDRRRVAFLRVPTAKSA